MLKISFTYHKEVKLNTISTTCQTVNSSLVLLKRDLAKRQDKQTNMSQQTIINAPKSEFEKLLAEKEEFTSMPALGDTIKGVVVHASKNEVRIDINGIHIGVVRGRELYNESPEYSALLAGDDVEATVVDLENENGEMELSFRFAGQQKAWDNLRMLQKE